MVFLLSTKDLKYKELSFKIEIKGKEGKILDKEVSADGFGLLMLFSFGYSNWVVGVEFEDVYSLPLALSMKGVMSSKT